jgi:hypothetical protein
MYCSNCGKSIAGNINYCNACGAPTEHSQFVPDTKAGRLFILSGTFIVVIGMIAFFPILRTLLGSPIDTVAKILLILSYLATVLLMFAATMTMGWKQINATAHRKTKNETLDDYRRPTSFRDINTSQLPTGDPGFGSVTDSTTRALDEVLIAPKSNP